MRIYLREQTVPVAIQPLPTGLLCGRKFKTERRIAKGTQENKRRGRMAWGYNTGLVAPGN